MARAISGLKLFEVWYGVASLHRLINYGHVHDIYKIGRLPLDLHRTSIGEGYDSSIRIIDRLPIDFDRHGCVADRGVEGAGAGNGYDGPTARSVGNRDISQGVGGSVIYGECVTGLRCARRHASRTGRDEEEDCEERRESQGYF